MVRKAKKNYFNNLNIKNIKDNKQFWKTAKSFFFNKAGNNERVTLIEEDKVVLKDRQVTETFKSYFETLVENLGMNGKFLSEEPLSNKSVTDIIKKFQNHPSIIKIKENYRGHFSFSVVKVEGLDWKIASLDASKDTQQNVIPVKVIKGNCNIFSEFIMRNCNEVISTARFLDILKSAEVKPVFKKNSRIDKENYRPVSILSVICKIFERLIFKQLIMFFEPVFSKYQCGFGKAIVNNTVYSL